MEAVKKSNVAQFANLPGVLAPMFKKLKEYNRVSSPCVYFLVQNDEIVYVGQTLNINSRIEHHLEDKKFNRVFYLSMSKRGLDEAETVFIQALKPKYNRRIRDKPTWPFQVLDKYGAKHLVKQRDIFQIIRGEWEYESGR
jgi:excinuclease UvrABC nuclease subunit